MATGARPQTNEVSGVDRDHVVNAWDVLAGNVQTGKKVAVIGGGLVGCEVADFLAEKGHEVTIIEMLPQIGTDIGPVVGPILFARLEKNNVKVIRCKAYRYRRARHQLRKDGKTEALGEFDSVVIAVGAALTLLTNQLEGSGTTYVIGDAETRRITHAVLEATRVAHEI